MDEINQVCPNLIETIEKVGSNFLDFLKNIDFGAVLAAAFGAGTLKILNNFVNVLDKFASVAENFSGLLQNIGDMFTSIGQDFKAKAFEHKSKAILNMAIAIGVLVIALVALTKIPEDKLWGAVGALVALSAVLVALSFAAKLMSQIKGFGKSAIIVVSMAASLILVAYAISELADIELSRASSAMSLILEALLKMSAIMVLVSKLLKPGIESNLKAAGSMFIEMAVAVGLMALVVKAASKLTYAEVSKGIEVIGGILLLFSGIIAVSKLSGEYSSRAGSMLIKISAAMGIMVMVVKEASKLTYSEVSRGIEVVGGISLLFAGIIVASKLAGEYSSRAGSMMLKMSAGMAIMVLTVKMISKLTQSEVLRGIEVIGAIEILFMGIIAVSKLAGEYSSRAGSMLFQMAGAILIITGAIYALSKMETDGLKKALGVITILEVLFGGLIAVSSLAKDCKTTLITITASVLVLVMTVALLTFIDTKKIENSVNALTKLMLSFGVLIKTVESLKNMNAKDMIGPLTLLLGVVGVLSLIVVALSKVNPLAALGSSIGLSALLLALSASMKILSTITYISNDTIKSMYLLSGVVAILGTILGLMAGLNVEASIPNAVALGVLLNAMSVAMVILDHVNYVSTSALGALAIMGAIVGELAIILGLMAAFNVMPSLETAESLSLLLLALSGTLVILEAVGVAAPLALAGVGALAVLIAGIGGLIVAIGALTTEFPKLKEFIDNGIPMLESIGFALGSFFGNIIDGFVSTAFSSLSDLGTYLSQFIQNAQPFLEGVKLAGDDAIKGVKNLVEMILLLTAADLIKSVAEGLTGKKSMNDFADQLIPFGESMVQFSNTIKGKVDGPAVEAAANAGKMLAEMARTIPATGGLVQFFTGEHDMNSFSLEIRNFGNAIVGFSETVKGKVDGPAIEAAANAGEMLAEMARTIPATGGLFQFFTGEHDMNSFSLQIRNFGNAIVDFSETVKGKVDGPAVEAAANAGSMLAEMARTIPATGGLFQFFAGEHDMLSFGSQLEAFGVSITRFSDSVSGNLSTEDITAAATAGKMLAEMAAVIPKDGSMFEIFTGDRDMGKFGEQLEDFGDAMKEFSKSVAGIDNDATIAAAEAAKIIAGIANTLPEKVNIGDFFEDEANLGGLARAIKSFSDESVGIQPYIVENGVSAGKKVIELAQAIPGEGGLKGIFSGSKESVSVFGEQLVSFGESIKTFSEEVTGIDGGSITTAVTVGKQMIELGTSIPSDGGLKGLISGDLNMTLFGNQLVDFGMAIKKFSNAVSGIEGGNVSTAVTSAKEVIELAKLIPRNGGSLGLATGSMKDFGLDLIALGEAIKQFVTEAGGVDVASIQSVVTQFNSAMQELMSVSETSLENIKMSFDNMRSTTETSFNEMNVAFSTASTNITNAMNNFSRDIKDTFTAMQGDINATFTVLVKSVEDSGRKLSIGMDNIGKDLKKTFDFMNKTSKSTFEELNASIVVFGNSIASNTDNVLLLTLKVIENRKHEFYNAGATLMEKFTDGINTVKTSIRKITERIAASAVNGINNGTVYGWFYNAGEYLVKGFANGITENTFMAVAQARAMALAAARAAEAALDINSPSKVFYQIGDYAGQGFVNAFADKYSEAYGAGSGIAESATNGLSDALKTITNMVLDDMDTEPVIRPILDLSNVSRGIQQIDTSFSRSQALSISASRNKRYEDEIQNQNGVNSPNGNTYTFTQNNYSPKALSRDEIYRQTKNQFSAMERMVES